MSSQTSSYDVHVGKILGAHGLRGAVRVLPHTDVPDRHKTLKEVLVRTARAERMMTVSAAAPTGKGLWLVKFDGTSDRTEAEKLTGGEILIRDEDLPDLPEGEYYVHQIVGLRVVTVSGRELGPVTEVLPTGANDVYVTEAGLIPATHEVVKEIDLQAGRMVIDPLPGMLEEPGKEDAD